MQVGVLEMLGEATFRAASVDLGPSFFSSLLLSSLELRDTKFYEP